MIKDQGLETNKHKTPFVIENIPINFNNVIKYYLNGVH